MRIWHQVISCSIPIPRDASYFPMPLLFLMHITCSSFESVSFQLPLTDTTTTTTGRVFKSLPHSKNKKAPIIFCSSDLLMCSFLICRSANCIENVDCSSSSPPSQSHFTSRFSFQFFPIPISGNGNAKMEKSSLALGTFDLRINYFFNFLYFLFHKSKFE